jgi:hypothetical protein
MIAFFLLLFVTLVIYYFTTTSMSPLKKEEGFANPTDPSIRIPTEKVPQPPSPPVSGEVKPNSLPGSLPASPYDQVSKATPLAYQDTTQIKANKKQIESLLEMLKGFLSFESQEIADRSDPTIQLPLNTARSDLQALQTELDVMNRNPGVQSSMTLAHLREISSNLAHLQREVRLIQNARGDSNVASTDSALSTFIQSLQAEVKEGFQTSAVTAASVSDLKNVVSRIDGEVARLNASGSTDVILRARVSALEKMRQDIKTILSQVEKGTLKESEIPIAKADIDKALPILGKPSEPLPQLVKSLELPSGVANLLPSSVSKDPETMTYLRDIVNKYADTIVNGISATFQVKYDPPHATGQQGGSTIDKTGFPSLFDLNNVSNSKFTPQDVGLPVTDRMAPTPLDAGRGPSHFDWKQRAKEIEDQVKKRGLNPADYGIMPKNSKVSSEFSWKGYAKMICTRLQATMDPALPETCGCPPLDWKGWRST